MLCFLAATITIFKQLKQTRNRVIKISECLTLTKHLKIKEQRKCFRKNNIELSNYQKIIKINHKHAFMNLIVAIL